MRQVAATIRLVIRNVDVVGRLGGDEFAVLFPETGAEGARQALQKIKQSLEGLATNHIWPCTFSIGVVTFLDPPASIKEMIEQADKTMYSVKTGGKNNIVFKLWPHNANGRNEFGLSVL